MTSGDGMELWAMKTLAGLYASNIDFETPSHRFRDLDIPMEQITRRLASGRPRSMVRMIVPLGLDEHEERLGRRAVSIAPIVNDASDRLLVC